MKVSGFGNYLSIFLNGRKIMKEDPE